MTRAVIHRGDSREILRQLEDASVDAVVTDPPYELAFMGKRWDASGVAYDPELWRQVVRVLKPGGHVLAFGATRTFHRMVVAAEDAGLEIRDTIAWVRGGQSMPKSTNVSKALDRMAGAERPVVGKHPAPAGNKPGGVSLNMSVAGMPRDVMVTAPATEAARAWDGWGTALKPVQEPVMVARKPLVGTIPANVLAHGVGGLNIDGCRVPHADAEDLAKHQAQVAALKARGGTLGGSWKNTSDLAGANDVNLAGRWPPNFVLAHSPACGDTCADGCAVAELDAQQEGATRMFPAFRYQGKPSRAERDAGLEAAPTRDAGAGRKNHHPTVKPVALMRWLVRLVTPRNGLVLDPFTGSGTTGVACVLEDVRFVGVELSGEYRDLALARIAHARADLEGEQLDLFGEA